MTPHFILPQASYLLGVYSGFFCLNAQVSSVPLGWALGFTNISVFLICLIFFGFPVSLKLEDLQIPNSFFNFLILSLLVFSSLLQVTGFGKVRPWVFRSLFYFRIDLIGGAAPLLSIPPDPPHASSFPSSSAAVFLLASQGVHVSQASSGSGLDILPV